MTVNNFYDLLNNKILVLDGATGTELQKSGMPQGVCPEKWAFDNPEVIMDIHKKYIDSGSDIIYSSTFGGTRLKLSEFGLGDKTYELNVKLAKLAKEAAGTKGYVAGDIAPTGKFIEPFGDFPFEDAVNVYKEQAKALLDGGVDLFVLETMIDIQEIRAALIAVKEICDLPVIASMTFNEDQLTLTGTDPVSALITLQSLGADIVGCNCSTGPDKMVEVIKKMKPFAKVPLLAKPNAGLPKLKNGKTIFDMTADEFASFVPDFLDAGVNLIGGCCGTSFEYIKKVKEKVTGSLPQKPRIKSISALSSARKTVFHEIGKNICIIGERINPTGKKKLQEELREGKFDEVKRFAVEQAQSGSDLLDVNMGMSGIDEKKMMINAVKILSSSSNLPLVIDSSNPEVIEAALRIYPGRALINSISAEKNKLDKLLPIAAKYGAMFILLPLNDNEIPKTADGRINIVNEIFSKAKEYGFTKDDIVVDCLVMTISSDQNAAKETLKLIKWCREVFKCNTVIGLSNVSFGLPQRKYINAGFLAMSIANGLSMAIANPSDELLMFLKYASDALIGNDNNCIGYIKKFSNLQDKKDKKESGKKDKNPEDMVYDSVLDGDKENIIEYIKKAINNNITPNNIVDDYLIKAINKVGDLYENKEYFLPQLIASAESMKTAFGYLEPLLSKKNNEDNKKKIKIILATVKGDIHDIGKNIVGLMLKNYGYKVIDLGKDVACDKIIETAVNEKVDIIGLSALMTTTMTEMKNVVDNARKIKNNIKIIIGGAVITKSYAEEIGADGFAKDGIEAVKLVGKLLSN